MADVRALLAEMLRDQPDAWVGAVGSDALYVPIPDAVPLADTHRRLQGRWALDHVAAGHRAPLTDAWRSRAELGHTSATVRLVSGGSATFHLFHLADELGADILVAVAEDDDSALGTPPTVPEILMSSRFARVLRDETGRTLEIDAAAPDVLGWSAEVLLGRSPPLERVHPDDRGEMVENWMATLADPDTGHRSRTRLARSDGTYRWFELTNFNHLDDPVRPHVTTEFLDISDEMAAHEAVRAREQLLHRLAEALPLGVLQLARDRTIVYKNDFLSAIVGAESATTMADQFAGTVDEDRPQLEAAFAASLDEGADTDVVIRMTPDGARSERLIRVITKSLGPESGEHTGVIACISDVTETERMGRELERRATFDALTGCQNRAAILGRLEDSLTPGEGGVAVIFLDLDDFKDVNDRCGHSVGDEVLKAAARVLESTTRDADHVGRLGGDEFLVVCPDVDEAMVMALAERISAAMARHPMVLGAHVPLRASIGVAWASRGSVSADDLVERADHAMYTSKRGGGGEPQLWDGGDSSALSA